MPRSAGKRPRLRGRARHTAARRRREGTGAKAVICRITGAIDQDCEFAIGYANLRIPRSTSWTRQQRRLESVGAPSGASKRRLVSIKVGGRGHLETESVAKRQSPVPGALRVAGAFGSRMLRQKRLRRVRKKPAVMRCSYW